MPKKAADVRQPEERPAPASNNRCNSTALRKATRRVSQLYDSILAPTGLRSTQRAILHNINYFGSPTVGKLAASLVLDRSALGHNLKPLEREGLLTLEPDPNDRRSRIARLTEKGMKKLADSAPYWQMAQERFESKFGVERAAALREVLAIIATEEFE